MWLLFLEKDFRIKNPEIFLIHLKKILPINKLLLWSILGEIFIVGALIYIPGLNSVFNNYPLSWNFWLILAAFIPSVFIVEELRKLIIRYVKNKSVVKIAGKEA